MIRKTVHAWMLILFCSAAGCNAVHEHVIDAEMDLRNCVLAQKAWGEWSWCYDDLDHPLHFAKGFKEGYRDVLDGGNGCQPTLPPQCYWKPQFQTPEGRCKINAWFEGFSHGALAAKQDGYGNLQELPISPTARANIMAKRAPAPRFPYATGAGEVQPAPTPDQLLETPPETPEMPAEELLPRVNSGDETDLIPPRPYEEN